MSIHDVVSEIRGENDMSANFIIVKVAGAPSGIFYDTEAVALWLKDADPTQNGPLNPFITQAQQMLALKVAEYAAANGKAANEGTILDILVQLMPMFVQLMPTLITLCPKKP